jgi:transcriptional regulator with XRE-family HTH domain
MKYDIAVGQRIAYYRKRRGYTEQVLAGFIGKSTAWMQEVEEGERIVERVSVLQQLANCLKVGLDDLIGGVELPPNGGEPLDPPRGIHAIRRAIFVPRLPDREPRPAAELHADVEHATRLGKSCSFMALAHVLPDLILDCRIAAAQGDPAAWWDLAEVYKRAAILAYHVGEPQLAWIAADRTVAAARQCEDTLLIAAAYRHMALALMRLGFVDLAAAVCSDAADAIAPTGATTPAGWSVWGCLQLTHAAAASRNSDTALAWRVLGDASSAAERADPEGHNKYDGSFGPANVVAHEVDVALESGDPGEALRRANSIEIDELANPERRARFCIDTAHAHSLRQDDAAAVRMLLKAEEYGPEVVRFSVKAHELVRVCLNRERKTRTLALRPLAKRLQIAV